MAKKKAKKKAKKTTALASKKQKVTTKRRRTKPPGPSQASKTKTIFELAPDLCEAAKKVGLTNTQIRTFTDPAALKEQIRCIKPTAVPSNLSSEPRAEVRHATMPSPKSPKLTAKTTFFNIEIDARRTQKVNHGSLIEMQLQSNIRRLKIRNVQLINLARPEVPDRKGKLVTQVTVHYKE